MYHWFLPMFFPEGLSQGATKGHHVSGQGVSVKWISHVFALLIATCEISSDSAGVDASGNK